MKIALIGSAPSSINLAPYHDPAYQIWACSPGTYPLLPRCDKFFELHRWEPGVIGKADTQKPWFTPEYVAWIKQQKSVIMVEPHDDVPNATILDVADLTDRYGNFFFSSSLSWMLAMAIDEIIADRKTNPDSKDIDTIGMFGVDMSATEEYTTQRPACQFFLQIAQQLGIDIIVPPESDLLRPPVLYGVVEHTHMHIKNTQRMRELQQRIAMANNDLAQAKHNVSFLQGAIDDVKYQMETWHESAQTGKVCRFNEMFPLKIND